MEETSRHRHSKSNSGSYQKVNEENVVVFPGNSHHLQLDTRKVKNPFHTDNDLFPKAELEQSLRKEILQLGKKLEDQFAVRRALEKALGYKSHAHDYSNETSLPKPANELIKEIAVLEYEVVSLEHYLLSLYRQAFEQHVTPSSPSSDDDWFNSALTTQKEKFFKVSGFEITSKIENSALHCSHLNFCSSLDNAESLHGITHVKETVLDSGVNHSQSPVSQHSVCSQSTECPDKSMMKCYSEPLSSPEHVQDGTTNVISLAELLGARISDHILETPNKLSENMIKCISSILYKLADPTLTGEESSLSPISSLSSINFSPQDQCETWSPQYGKDSSLNASRDSSFSIEGLKAIGGPYSLMVQVSSISRDDKRLADVDDMLQTYRSHVCQLEEIDPRRMKHEEKLAFWINIHNALVMHAFLVYGIPQNNQKRMSLLLKAAYNVGGQTVSTDMIQTSILGCRIPRPEQWLWMLYSPRTKLKPGDDRQAYAIERTEPLLHFALCSGCHSDPAVRVYTPKKVMLELTTAKEEYISANFGALKKEKLQLPKLLESFAKDADLCPVGVVEMIQKSLPEIRRKSMQKYLDDTTQKNIKWLPHNFAFRYLISKELIK